MPVVTKSTRAANAAATCDTLTREATTIEAAVTAARWAGEFRMLAQHAGYLSASAIDAHIDQARATLPGFDDRLDG